MALCALYLQEDGLDLTNTEQGVNIVTLYSAVYCKMAAAITVTHCRSKTLPCWIRTKLYSNFFCYYFFLLCFDCNDITEELRKQKVFKTPLHHYLQCFHLIQINLNVCYHTEMQSRPFPPIHFWRRFGKCAWTVLRISLMTCF